MSGSQIIHELPKIFLEVKKEILVRVEAELLEQLQTFR